MHISIGNISKTVTNMTKHCQEVIHYLSFGILAFDHGPVQGQGHAHFDCKYLENGERYGNRSYCR